MRPRSLVLLAVVVFALFLTAVSVSHGAVTPREYSAIHQGQSRHHVQHTVLHAGGQHLSVYRAIDGVHHVRRYRTARRHTWVVVDYLEHVRTWAPLSRRLRVVFKTRCTWGTDGVDCTPGAPS